MCHNPEPAGLGSADVPRGFLKPNKTHLLKHSHNPLPHFRIAFQKSTSALGSSICRTQHQVVSLALWIFQSDTIHTAPTAFPQSPPTAAMPHSVHMHRFKNGPNIPRFYTFALALLQMGCKAQHSISICEYMKFHSL